MTDAELEALAVKCGIYWGSEKTAYMHTDTMRAFAEALFKAERERCAKLCEEIALDHDKNGDPRNQFVSVPQDGCDECAAAIRDR